jgi:hypothetical protein
MFLFKTKPRRYGMGKKEENTSFTCAVCQRYVKPQQNGSYRNHCPFCLSSVHVDSITPGDRKSSCHGIMKAYMKKYSTKKGWQIIHKCMKCQTEKTNKIAEVDPQSDSWEEIVRLTDC